MPPETPRRFPRRWVLLGAGVLAVLVAVIAIAAVVVLKRQGDVSNPNVEFRSDAPPPVPKPSPAPPPGAEPPPDRTGPQGPGRRFRGPLVRLPQAPPRVSARAAVAAPAVP